MGRSYDAIPDHIMAWLPAQPLWFVASAPTGPDGHVNVSPKAGDTVRVLDASSVAYLDLTGSGADVEGVAEYQATRYQRSIDGLPALGD